MNRKVRTTRLGWADESRAKAEAAKAGPAVTIRQLRDLSWALCWPDGTVRGRFGVLLFSEQQWLEERTATREPRTTVRLAFTLDLTDAQRRAIGNAVRGEKGKALATVQQVTQWARAELAVSLLDAEREDA